ncbi:MAG: BrxA/BrxB family bacilliredoxin [Flavobacteriales bacterium]|jgi:putative YphP/YqiW family bacilliredoxin|nr:BrxA/BrxB family bacilliredoxin [Flavobacteriales bacterium]MDC3390352.1 BrxA/BrxB family bacilliredoxin [Flavobacteriales bacterium]|tara:strand:+ start:504 stop:920 length:417 start_codon:yes stop_codon:yes gene_type:complete
MNYPEEMCAPMRSELVSAGFVELKTPESVSDLLSKKTGTTLVMVNSVCGCAAGNARPAVIMATNFDKQVDTFATVFAGQDIGATAKAREFMLPFPPSSPSIAVFKEGKLVHFIERHHIEGRAAEMIADNLKNCFDQIC